MKYFVVFRNCIIFVSQNTNDMKRNSNKKTIVNTENQDLIKIGFQNPFGMLISNDPAIREAVASEAHEILNRIRAKHGK